MRISEAIEILESIKDEHGDLLIYITHEWAEPIESIKYAPEYINTPYRLNAGVFPERVNIQ